MTPLERYARFWEELSAARLPALADLLARDVRFKDPFNDVRGVAATMAVMRAMFDHGSPSFAISERALGAAGTGFLRWRCTIARARGPAIVLEGVSEIRFDAAGLVIEHVDHWDAAEQVYEHVPVLGALLRMVKRRLSATTPHS
jgi:hypothetical protein